MSDTDSFIQEVTEEVRQDRMFALWKKWAPYILGGLILMIAAAAAWTWMETRDRASDEASGAMLLGADAQSLEEQQRLAEALEPPARLIAEFGTAAQLARQGETAVAEQAYRAIAARGEVAGYYRQLALLQALRLAATTEEPSQVLGELAALMVPGAPFAPLARELAAALHLKAGDLDAARTELQTILADPLATRPLKLRARELLATIGDSAPKQAG